MASLQVGEKAEKNGLFFSALFVEELAFDDFSGVGVDESVEVGRLIEGEAFFEEVASVPYALLGHGEEQGNIGERDAQDDEHNHELVGLGKTRELGLKEVEDVVVNHIELIAEFLAGLLVIQQLLCEIRLCPLGQFL